MEVSAGAGGPIRREGSRADGPSRATVAYKGVHFGQRALAEASRRGLSVSSVMQTKEGTPGTRKKYTDARAVWKALLLVHDIAGSEWEQKTQQELLVVARAYVDDTVSRCAKGGLGPIEILSSAVGRMHVEAGKEATNPWDHPSMRLAIKNLKKEIKKVVTKKHAPRLTSIRYEMIILRALHVSERFKFAPPQSSVINMNFSH